MFFSIFVDCAWKVAESVKDAMDSRKLNRLKKRGMKFGKNFYFSYSDDMDAIRPDLITFGDDCTVSTRVTILTHDASTKKGLGVSRFAEVLIGNNVYIGAGATILPGTCIGDNVIIGAGSVVKGIIEANSVYVGCPAKKIKEYDAYIATESQSYEKHGNEIYYVNGLRHFYDD